MGWNGACNPVSRLYYYMVGKCLFHSYLINSNRSPINEIYCCHSGGTGLKSKAFDGGTSPRPKGAGPLRQERYNKIKKIQTIPQALAHSRNAHIR